MENNTTIFKVKNDVFAVVCTYNYDVKELTYQVYPILDFSEQATKVVMYLPLVTRTLSGSLEECKNNLKLRLNNARKNQYGSSLVSYYLWKDSIILTASYNPADYNFTLITDTEGRGGEGSYAYTNVYIVYEAEKITHISAQPVDTYNSITVTAEEV